MSPTFNREAGTLNKPVLPYKRAFKVFRTCAQSFCYQHLSNKICSNSTLQISPYILEKLFERFYYEKAY